jgi:hypothetical protein
MRTGMISKRKRYPREFKIDMVYLIAGSNHSVVEVFQDPEIHFQPMIQMDLAIWRESQKGVSRKREANLLKLKNSADSGVKISAGQTRHAL